MYLDEIRPGDREQVLELQKRTECQFPVPDPLTGFVIREPSGKVLAWAGWEPVAEVLGIVDPELPMKQKIRMWASLHKPVESEIVRKGITAAYVHLRKEHSRFAAVLNYMGWSFCPGYWLRRDAGVGIKPNERDK